MAPFRLYGDKHGCWVGASGTFRHAAAQTAAGRFPRSISVQREPVWPDCRVALCLPSICRSICLEMFWIRRSWDTCCWPTYCVHSFLLAANCICLSFSALTGRFRVLCLRPDRCRAGALGIILLLHLPSTGCAEVYFGGRLRGCGGVGVRAAATAPPAQCACLSPAWR